tara:strand:- start:355 stop:789 length:435 start_codon:yes stop_codon:yes gene_type:complete
MIISCEKCNKKFELSDELIPDEGRLLQCGSCSHKWHYTPTKTIKLVNEIDQVTTSKKKTKKIKKSIIKENNEIEIDQATLSDKKKGMGFLSFILVSIISLIALVIIIDTFKIYIVSFIPNIDLYLSSLYESLRDMFLFFKDLIK